MFPWLVVWQANPVVSYSTQKHRGRKRSEGGGQDKPNPSSSASAFSVFSVRNSSLPAVAATLGRCRRRRFALGARGQLRVAQSLACGIACGCDLGQLARPTKRGRRPVAEVGLQLAFGRPVNGRTALDARDLLRLAAGQELGASRATPLGRLRFASTAVLLALAGLASRHRCRSRGCLGRRRLSNFGRGRGLGRFGRGHGSNRHGRGFPQLNC